MLLKLSRFFLYATIFSVVVVLTSTFFPFIGGKYYFFRLCTEFSLIFMLLWWAFQAPAGELKKRFEKISGSWIFRAVSIFVLVFLLASVFGDDPKVAFWSNFERGEGGFQMLHYYAFFVLMGMLFQEKKDWIRAFKVSLVAGAGMILYGVAAAMGLGGFIGAYRDGAGNPIAPTFLGRLFSDSRFQGSLGNPAYVAPYLLFSMFYAFYLWVMEKWQKNVWKHVVYGGSIVIALIFFVLSQTRGGFLGLVAAIGAFVIYIVFSDPRLRKKAAIGLGVLVVLGALLFGFRGTIIAHNIPGGRFLNISLTDQTAKTRFWTWGSAWAGFKDHPILGWGPENFSTVFDKHFNTNHYIPGQNTETWFDRAHSVVFDYLAETGILGFLAYMSMLVAFYYEFFVAQKKGYESSPTLRGLLFVIPIAYFVQALILFDVLPIYLNLFLVLGFAMYEFNKSNG
jgi:O-antigen ligase